jgi:hypothetical protein
MANKTKRVLAGVNFRLAKEDDPLIAKAVKILEGRGLVRPKMVDAVRIALAEFVRGGK